jgi:outer membrane protein
MKKVLFTCLIVISGILAAQAQKIGFVDSQYILDNIPEYAEAQAQLDDLSAQWQKELEAKFAEVDKMYKDYQAQSVLLPEDMKKKKEQEIVDKEREAKELQRQRYGKDGDLFKKRQELIKPIQERVYNAIQEIATSNNYAIILDKAGALTLMYANPKYDISDEVLDNLGTSSVNRRRATPPSTSGSGTSGSQGTPPGKSGAGSESMPVQQPVNNPPRK